jgi:hypothetical protein
MASPAFDSADAFVEYAWGDRRFFMESRYAPWSVLATLFWPTDAVAYVAARSSPPDASRVRALQRRDVSGADVAVLVQALERWIVRSPRGDRVPAHARVAGYPGVFHRAYGLYSWWHNCNRWTVAQLAQAQLAEAHAAIYWPAQVMSRLREFTRVTPDDAGRRADHVADHIADHVADHIAHHTGHHDR